MDPEVYAAFFRTLKESAEYAFSADSAQGRRFQKMQQGGFETGSYAPIFGGKGGGLVSIGGTFKPTFGSDD